MDYLDLANCPYDRPHVAMYATQEEEVKPPLHKGVVRRL